MVFLCMIQYHGNVLVGDVSMTVKHGLLFERNVLVKSWCVESVLESWSHRVHCAKETTRRKVSIETWGSCMCCNQKSRGTRRRGKSMPFHLHFALLYLSFDPFCVFFLKYIIVVCARIVPGMEKTLWRATCAPKTSVH